MLHYLASMNVTGWVITVGDELRYVVEVLFSVLSFLNWQAASAAMWQNSYTPILVGESWQEDAWEFAQGNDCPLSTMERNGLTNLVVLHESLYRLNLFWNVVVWGGWTLRVSGWPQGKWRRSRKGMLVFSNTSCYCQCWTSVKESQSCTSGLTIILAVCLSSCLSV